MSAVRDGTTTDPLLVEWFAERLGFEAVSKRWPGADPYPPYLFVGAVLFVDFGIGNTARQLLTGSQLWIAENPFSALIPMGLILTVVGIRYMSDGLRESIRHLTERQGDDIELRDRPISFRTVVAVYLACLAAVYGHVVFVVGLDALFRVRGVIWTFVTTFVIGPLYISVVVEAVLIYLSIHLLLPRQLADSGLSVHFFDPRQMGGFRPFGELLKRSYYLYTAGLLLYLTWIYGPVLVPTEYVVVSEPGAVAAVFFTLLWLVGLATLSYSIHKIHRIMTREKETKIREIEAELYDTVDDPYDVAAANINEREKFDEVQQRLDFVRSTSTYPTTFTMWTQILISVILPQIVQLSVQTTL